MTHTKTFLATMVAMVTLFFVTIGLLDLIHYLVKSPTIAIILFFALMAAAGLALAVWLDQKDHNNAGS